MVEFQVSYCFPTISSNEKHVIIAKVSAAMKGEEKIWFKRYSTRLWIPVSIEGWVVYLAFSLGLLLVYRLNEVSDDVAFSFIQHWIIILEFGIVIAAFYWVSRGHVDRR